MLAKLLIALGLNFRSAVLLAVFLALFIFASIVVPFASTGKIETSWLYSLIPLFIVFVILLCALISKSTRMQLIANKKEDQERKKHERPNKLSIAFACHGTYVAVGILLLCLLVVLQLEKYIFEIFAIYVFGGWIIIYKIMWPFFTKRMK